MKRFMVLALCALPVPAAAQEDDRGYLTALLEDNLSGAGRKITITGFEGALSSKARIAALTIADEEGVWLSLKDVVLDWNRSALLTGNVSVNELTAGEIVLARLPETEADSSLPAPEATPFALPELPVSVKIGKLATPRLSLGPTVLGQPVEAVISAAVSLEGGEGEAQLALDRMDGGPPGKLALTASYANGSRVLALDLQASEGAGGIAASLLGLPGTPAVDLTVKGEGPLDDYAADLRLLSDGEERLAGRVSVSVPGADEPQGALGFTANLGGDLAPLFAPDYAEFFGPDVALQAIGAKGADGRLDLSQLQVTTRALELGGSLSLAADGLPEKIDLKGQLGLDGKPVLLPLTTEERTLVDHADLAITFDAAQDEAWTANVQVQGLSRADLTAESARIIGNGAIVREATPRNAWGLLDITLAGLAPRDPALAKALGDQLTGQVAFQWTEGQPTFDLTALTLNGPDYRFDGKLSIGGLDSALTLTGSGDLTADDLSRFADLAGQPLAGRASATLAGQTALLSGAFDVTGQVRGNGLKIGVAEVDSLLSGASTIDLAMTRDESGTRLDRLDIAAASLTAKANGTIATAGSDITADLAFADLRALGPQYRGSLNGLARFQGTPEAGRVSLDAKGQSLAIGVAEADNLLKGDSTIQAEATLAGSVVQLQRLEVNAASLGVKASGKIDPAGHDLSADLAFRDLRALGGGYRGTLAAKAAFKGTPENGSLTATATGTGLAIGQAEADRLLAGNSRLAANLRLQGGQIKIDSATLENPQLRVAAKGDIAGNQRQVTLDAALANLGLLLPEFPGRLSVTGKLADDGNGYNVDLAAKGPGGIALTTKGRMAPDFSRGDLAINGNAKADLANAFVSPTTVSGGLGIDLRLNGPLVPASLGGRVTLNGLRLANPALPNSVEGLNGAVSFAGGRAQLDLKGGLNSGGAFTVGGSAGLAAPYQGDITVALRDLQLKDPQLYQTKISGDLSVRGPLTGGAMIAGEILLKETELQVPSTGLGGAAGLEDLRHVAEPGDVRLTRQRAGLVPEAETAGGGGGSSRPFGLDLTISAPQRIFVRGRGLDMELGGSLRVSGTTANIVPSGAFELVRGRLDILGKRLTIAQAQLQMQGDFDPWLSVLASNESDGITSSVKIEGNASSPKVSFVSSPELPEEEVLARLLFNRDLSALSAFQAAQLASAVATLAGKGGDGIMSKLRKGFGLDDLDISTNAEGQTEVKAGKYISKNAYTEVEVDGEGKAKINLNLDVTPTVTLRGSVGAEGETSIGIFKEKDY